MNRPVHFEIYADDVDRALKFYQAVFGWKFEKWDMGGQDYWMAMTGDKDTPGINGGLMKRPGPPPQPGMSANSFVCCMDVEDLNQSVTAVSKAGGQVVEPRIAVPGMGYMAFTMDTEGNIFEMMQEDRQAK